MLKSKIKSLRFMDRANAAIKADLQERRARRGLEWYRKEAQRRGIECPKGVALQDALRRRLAERGVGSRPREKGGLHIFLAYCVATWETVLPLSLAPFGEVTQFDWRAHGYDDTGGDWLEQRDRMNAEMLARFREAQRQRPVDVVIGYLSGHNTAPATLREMSGAGAVIFNFCWDDKLNFPGPVKRGRFTSPAAIADVVDLNLTNAVESTIKYAVHGGLAMFWPEAAHPDVDRPHDVPFEFDVSFVGGCHGWRPEFVRRLGHFGINVECFGGGWPNGRVTNAERVRLYSASRINLGFAGVGHSRRLMCLKARDFEVPMCGGLYLTQDNPELASVFDVGREVLTYRDEEHCADIIKELLADDDRASGIRQAGRQRCLREHTYETRWSEVFGMAGILASKGAQR